MGQSHDAATKRVALAFVISPLAVPAFYAALLRTPLPLYFSAIAYPAALITGVPAYLFLRSRGYLQIWAVVPACALLAGVVGLLITASAGGDAHTTLWQSLILCFYGAITGLIFWVIAFMPLPSTHRWRGP